MPLSSNHDANSQPTGPVVVTDLARYAIKGLSGDRLDAVLIPKGGVQTFPDDRRFALLKRESRGKFNDADPEWLHKDNFLCAFSAPELMASFRSRYEIVDGDDGRRRRRLTLYRRDGAGDAPALGPLDLGLRSGRDALAAFFSTEAGRPLVCVAKEADGEVSTFQFGNTRAGAKHNPGGDTRTVHIVNAATVRELAGRVGHELHALRFRPNIVIDGAAPWEEFQWIGRRFRVVAKGNGGASPAGNEGRATLIVKVLTKTVRCAGISIDPLDPSAGKIDMPRVLSEHYPEHGPYLGVYASIEVAGGDEEVVGQLLSVGDTLELL